MSMRSTATRQAAFSCVCVCAFFGEPRKLLASRACWEVAAISVVRLSLSVFLSGRGACASQQHPHAEA